MITIPVTIFDDFLPNPELWVDMSKNCRYSEAAAGNWPGKRSECISVLNPYAFRLLCTRFFSIFYSLENENINWKVTAKFQKINSNGEGWIHYDKSVISGIVYLSEDASPSCGTAIYEPKSIRELIHTDKKVDSIISNNLDYNRQFMLANNSNFEESIRVNNKFNRLLAFDCGLPHRALNFNNNDKERLTLVFFVEKLLSENTPISRSRKVLNVS